MSYLGGTLIIMRLDRRLQFGCNRRYVSAQARIESRRPPEYRLGGHSIAISQNIVRFGGGCGSDIREDV